MHHTMWVNNTETRCNRPLLLLAVVAILAAGVALAMLFASLPPGNDSAEAGFARDMIVHHGQAVRMAEIIRDSTESDEMRLLATVIAHGAARLSSGHAQFLWRACVERRRPCGRAAPHHRPDRPERRRQDHAVQ